MSSSDAAVPISEPETVEADKTDPGACRHGNFINYYQFHPAKERLEQLPRHVWHAAGSGESTDRKYVGIDVGCNAGDLTIALHDFLNKNLNVDKVCLLGVDLDPILIERAIEGNGSSSLSRDVSYKCVDFMSREISVVLDEYLEEKEREIFDVAFCFSITMWIHLNHGDEGLVKFLKSVCERTNLIVVEPQPWKCYRNACRRLKRAKVQDLPLINKLKYNGDVVNHIDNILNGPNCRFEKVTETPENEWGRKLLIYKKTTTL